MKRVLLLPIMAIGLMVSQAWGEHCTESGQLAFCQWGTGCFTINNDYAPNVGVDCSALIASCKKDGTLYTGASVPAALSSPPYGEGANCANLGLTKAAGGNESCGYYCKWETGCYEIKTDINGDNGPAVATCTDAIAACDKDGSRFSNATCSGSQVGGNESCGYYCLWPTGCVEIKTDLTGENNGGVPVTSCAAAIENCDSYGQKFPNAGCTGTQPPIDPIISIGRSVGLTIVPNGNMLHIISDKAATVELFSMTGAKVFSSKVAAGNSSLSLGNQKTGVYYAVVKSGSQKQTVKVVLK